MMQYVKLELHGRSRADRNLGLISRRNVFDTDANQILLDDHIVSHAENIQEL